MIITVRIYTTTVLWLTLLPYLLLTLVGMLPHTHHRSACPANACVAADVMLVADACTNDACARCSWQMAMGGVAPLTPPAMTTLLIDTPCANIPPFSIIHPRLLTTAPRAPPV
mgnify:CR=1 FL=1